MKPRIRKYRIVNGQRGWITFVLILILSYIFNILFPVMLGLLFLGSGMTYYLHTGRGKGFYYASLYLALLLFGKKAVKEYDS